MTDATATASAAESSPKSPRPEDSQPGVLSEIQLLGEELKTLHEVIDDLLSEVSFDGGVPVAFERVSWLMNTAQRLNLLILERAYS